MKTVCTSNIDNIAKFNAWLSGRLVSVRAKKKVSIMLSRIKRIGIDILPINKDTRALWLGNMCPRKYYTASPARRIAIVNGLIAAGLVYVSRLRTNKVISPEEFNMIHEFITEIINVNIQDIDNKSLSGCLMYGPVSSGKTYTVKSILESTPGVRPVYINANDIETPEYIDRCITTESGENVLSMLGARGLSGDKVLVIDDFDSLSTCRLHAAVIRQVVLLFKPTKGQKSLHHIESIFANQAVVVPVILICNNPFAKKLYNMYRVFKVFDSAIIKWNAPSDDDIRSALIQRHSRDVEELAADSTTATSCIIPSAVIDTIVSGARGYYTQMEQLSDMYVLDPRPVVFTQDIRSHTDILIRDIYTGQGAPRDIYIDKLDTMVWMTYMYALNTINSGKTGELDNLIAAESISECISFNDIQEAELAENIYSVSVSTRIPQVAALHFMQCDMTDARRVVIGNRIIAEETRMKCILERTKQKISRTNNNTS